MGPNDFFPNLIGHLHSATRGPFPVHGQRGQPLLTPRASLSEPPSEDADGVTDDRHQETAESYDEGPDDMSPSEPRGAALPGREARSEMQDHLRSVIELSQTLQCLIGGAETQGRTNRKAMQAKLRDARHGAAENAPAPMSGRVVGRIEGGRIIAMSEQADADGTPRTRALETDEHHPKADHPGT